MKTALAVVAVLFGLNVIAYAHPADAAGITTAPTMERLMVNGQDTICWTYEDGEEFCAPIATR